MRKLGLELDRHTRPDGRSRAQARRGRGALRRPDRDQGGLRAALHHRVASSGRREPGASPHFHRQHADSFYVLEGGLAVLVVRRGEAAVGGRVRLRTAGGRARVQEHVSPRASSTSTRRTAASHGICRRGSRRAGRLRQLRRPPGAACRRNRRRLPPPGEGERLEGKTPIATIKIGREELALIEFELEPGFEGPGPAHPRRPRRLVLRARGRARVPRRRTRRFVSAPARSSLRRSASCTRFRTRARTARACSTSTRRASASTSGCGR